jgi:hypothetical protein
MHRRETEIIEELSLEAEEKTQHLTRKKDPEIEELKSLNEELYKRIGKQNIELEFLKKKYRQLQNM